MAASTLLPRRTAPDWASWVLKVVVLALVYHLAARVGLQLAYVQINTSPVWPPTGIALAALLTFGIEIWPGVALGVMLGSLLTGAPWSIAVGLTMGNTLEALAGAIRLRRVVRFHNAIDRIQDVVGLATCRVWSGVSPARLAGCQT